MRIADGVLVFLIHVTVDDCVTYAFWLLRDKTYTEWRGLRNWFESRARDDTTRALSSKSLQTSKHVVGKLRSKQTLASPYPQLLMDFFRVV